MQHTVPSSVPLESILHQTLGGSNASVTDGNIELVMERLEECVGQIYDACFVNAVRRLEFMYLQENETEKMPPNTKFGVHNLVFTDSLDCVRFDLSWRPTLGSSTTIISCKVSLSFGDPMSLKPTELSVTKLDSGKRDAIGQTEPPVNGRRLIEDDSHHDHNSYLIKVRKVFEENSIKGAINGLLQL